MTGDINGKLGATPLGANRCNFVVWAPFCYSVDVHLISPVERYVRLKNVGSGYFSGIVENVPIGSRYLYRLNGSSEFPDPASRLQPDGVHNASEVIDHSFEWSDHSWRGIPLSDFIIYELHVGAFSSSGSFDGVIEQLDYLVDLGITAIELMPVAQFSGPRNWGYDGVYPYAVQNSYGGHVGFKRLVDACHNEGIAVILDVVYNHLGPEGNYSGNFGPYYSDRYKTFWGPALNFDGPLSDEVRRFFIENALSWIENFHVDALRLDAVHCIYDFSATHILRELTDEVHEASDRLGRRVWVIAESDLNDSRVLTAPELGGYGLDAQWNDDFHHSLHTLITDERTGYYQDFGKVKHLVRALEQGFVFSGEYSFYRRRSHGNSSRAIPLKKFVVFSQNHDQIGNRPSGDRLSANVSFETLKLAASLVLLSPSIPLLFMGEEYGEKSPFPFFVSYSDKDLVRAVRRGRRADLKELWGRVDPLDPQDQSTFLAARLNIEFSKQRPHATLLQFYKWLIAFRKTQKALFLDSINTSVVHSEKHLFLALFYHGNFHEISILFNFKSDHQELCVPLKPGAWSKVMDSSDELWGGPVKTSSDKIKSDGEAMIGLVPRSVLILKLDCK